MQDREPAGLVDRVVEGAQHLAVERRDVHLGEVLGEGLSGDGERVAVHQARVEQRLHEHRQSAAAVDVVHHVLAERLQVADVRHLRADAVEVVEGELDLGLAGDREQVQHDVRGAAEGHAHRDGVLERLLGEDLTRGDAVLQQVDDGLARAVRVVVATAVGGCR